MSFSSQLTNTLTPRTNKSIPIPRAQNHTTQQISTNGPTNNHQTPSSLQKDSSPAYSHTSKIASWEPLCYPACSAGPLKLNKNDPQQMTNQSKTSPDTQQTSTIWPMKLSTKSPNSQPISAVWPNKVPDHQEPLKSSKTSTRSSLLLRRQSQQQNTPSQAMQPEINIGDEQPSKINEPSRSYFWKTSIPNKRKTICWVRKLTE